MATPSERAETDATRSVSTRSISQPAQAIESATNQERRVAWAQHLRSHVIPTVQNNKAVLSRVLSIYSTMREIAVTAGCISSPSSDILAHMHPNQVLRGLLEDPEYMLQYEHELQRRDRCLWSCDMANEKIAAHESLLAKRTLLYTRLMCLLDQDTPDALKEEKVVLNLLEDGSQNVVEAEKALKDDLESGLKKLEEGIKGLRNQQ